MIKLKELISEGSAPASKLLKTIVDGDTNSVNGVKIDKKSAETLLKIYKLLDVSGQRNFDKMSADKLMRAFSDLI